MPPLPAFSGLGGGGSLSRTISCCYPLCPPATRHWAKRVGKVWLMFSNNIMRKQQLRLHRAGDAFSPLLPVSPSKIVQVSRIAPRPVRL